MSKLVNLYYFCQLRVQSYQNELGAEVLIIRYIENTENLMQFVKREGSENESIGSRCSLLSSEDSSLKRLLSWDFTEMSAGNEQVVPENCEDFESALAEDMLNIFLGFNGTFLKANPISNPNDMRTFRICGNVHPSVINIIETLLPIASDYSNVVRFIEENTKFSAGRVNQALASQFSEEVMFFMKKVASLENLPYFNLNVIWTAMQEDAQKLAIMRQICDIVRSEEGRGGATLSVLHSCAVNCILDSNTHSICLRWTKAASAPFFESLEKWLFKGEILDPLDEFMIAEKEDIKKFILRKEFTPQFLSGLSQVILTTGRYMRCVSQSSCLVFLPPNTGFIQYDSFEVSHNDAIKKAHEYANTLLRRLLNEENTLKLLEFVKSLFCLEYGDLFFSILKALGDNLEVSVPCDLSRIYSFIYSALKESSVAASEFCNKVRVHIERVSLPCQLNNILNVSSSNDTFKQKVREALTFSFKVDWPQKFILDDKTLICYQMLFRHIFYIKYVLMRLTKTFLPLESDCHFLKHSMTVFCQTLISYMTVETIEPFWDEFKTAYSSLEDVDQMVQAHNNYIYKVISACMISSVEMFQTLREVLEICQEFAESPEKKLQKKFEDGLEKLGEKAFSREEWSTLCDVLYPLFKKINTDHPESSLFDDLSFTSSNFS